MKLTRLNQYGGLHFHQKDVKDVAGVRVAPTGPPVKWKMSMTRPGSNNLRDPVTNVIEVEEVILILGYEWE